MFDDQQELYQQELANFLNMQAETTCSDEENKRLYSLIESGQPLPPGYRSSEIDHTTFLKSNVPQLEQKLKLQNAKNLRTIKNCVIFFTVLAALQLVFGFILSLASSAG